MPIYHRAKERFEVVTLEEITRYSTLAKDLDFRLLIECCWLTGARIQELLNLVKEDVQIDEPKGEVTFVIKALKRGKVGYPSFSLLDPFMEGVVTYIKYLQEGGKLFKRGKRSYEYEFERINKILYPDNKDMWLVPHYLRHSRITFITRELQASPEEVKSWTGHKSTAFEEYFRPRRVDRFRGKTR